MPTTETAARPDLSALAWDVRLRIAVAETQGATWEPPDDYGFELRFGPMPAARVGRNPSGITYRALPNYPGDSAAWGALQDAERIDVAYNEFIEGVGPYVLARHRPIQFWDHAKETGEAVSLATLRKHNHPDLPALLESRP